MQQVTDLHQVAAICADNLIGQLPPGPCMIAGVGLCAMVAAELTLQLHSRQKQVQLLTVFESVPVSQARLALPALDETLTSELVHVWCAVYGLMMDTAADQQQLVGESGGSSQRLGMHESAPGKKPQPPQQRLPELHSMMTHLHSLQDYEEQLEYISSFRPAVMEPQLWDRRVHETLSRVLHLMQLLHVYQPRDSLRCPVILVHNPRGQPSPVGRSDSLAQVADDCWKHVAPALLPVVTCAMVTEARGNAAASSTASVSTLDALIATAVGQSGAAATAEMGKSARNSSHLAEAVPLNGQCVDYRWAWGPHTRNLSSLLSLCNASADAEA